MLLRVIDGEHIVEISIGMAEHADNVFAFTGIFGMRPDGIVFEIERLK